MPRTSKPKTPVDSSVAVVDTNVVVVEKSKKTKVPKVELAPVPVSDVVSSPVDEVVVDGQVSDLVDFEAAIASQSTEFLAKLNQLNIIVSSLKNEYRVMEKKWSRELKIAQKVNSKRKRKSGNRAPSGFVKPTRISDELAKFLDKAPGTEMARTDVTREINKYIRGQNLQDKDNGRKINPDTKLTSLLKLKKTDELTYFNLQRYMSPHFFKAVKEPVVVVA